MPLFENMQERASAHHICDGKEPLQKIGMRLPRQSCKIKKKESK